MAKEIEAGNLFGRFWLLDADGLILWGKTGDYK
jgi:hypothetical protein